MRCCGGLLVAVPVCGQVSCHARYVAIVKLFAGRYELGRVLGAGGMAKVYAAHDRAARPTGGGQAGADRTGRADLAPTIHSRGPSAAAFTHPNAVALFDAGEADDFLYLVMEFVDGQSLADRLAVAGPLDPGVARHIASSVLAALAAAHVVGVVHRDVKPGNIILAQTTS